jgi:hypothetical protein
MRMAPKWYEYVEKRLKPEEQIDKNFEGRLDGDFGYLFITNQRLLFLKQEGFLRKSYEITLDLPKGNVESIEPTGKFELEVIESGGASHKFESDIGISNIERIMEEAIKTD